MKKPIEIKKKLFGDEQPPTYLSFVSDGMDLIQCKECYSFDDVAVVAVMEIDYDFQFRSSDKPKTACAITVMFLNRTEEFISLSIGGNASIVLVDDAGAQYSPLDNNLYWVDIDNGQPGSVTFMTHEDIIAPEAKLEGFFLFPKLKPRAERFSRLFLSGQFKLGNEWIAVKYKVEISE